MQVKPRRSARDDATVMATATPKRNNYEVEERFKGIVSRRDVNRGRKREAGVRRAFP
jgi:hypothetical protein